MSENSNQIKDRMLKTAAKVWGDQEYLAEATFDPLVGMLVSACAFELAHISREVNETRLRVSEKLIDLLVPDANAGVLPAHALATAVPIEDSLLLKPEANFYVAEGRLKEKRTSPLPFSSAGNFRLINGKVAGMLHSGGFSIFEQQHVKTEVFRFNSNMKTPDHKTLWIALEIPDIQEIMDLSLYFDCRNSSFRKNFYYLLKNSSWFAGGQALNFQEGFSTALNDDDFLLKVFGRKGVNYYGYMTHIRKFYEEQFITINLYKEQLKTGIPEELKSFMSTLSNELEKKISSWMWLKIEFSQLIEAEKLDEVSCSINTFPVASINNDTKIFKSRKNLNLFALKDEDYFFDLEQIEDSDGRTYIASQSEKVTDIEDNFYVLRRNGVESFDDREASEHITYLIEKLKNESASFHFLDKVNFNEDLKHLSQIMARLELNQEELPDFNNSFYLYLNTKKENVSIFVHYRTTSGDAANGLKPGTVLSLKEGSDLLQTSAFLVTMAQGGRSRMNREDRMNTLRRALLSRDRIVTEADLKAFCYAQFGKYLKSVKIKKGAYKDFATKGGIERTIDLYLILDELEYITESDMHFLCKDLLIALKSKSSSIFPYRIFIDNKLVEL